MKTRIFPLAGVTDQTNEKGVAYLQDFLLDGNTLKRLPMPELQQIEVPRTARHIWSYRGKFHFSEKRRSYAARHSILEEVYYSEAGGRAMQLIAGKEAKLGIERPLEPPTVQVGSPFSPGGVKGEMVANAGTKPKGTTRYIRLAFRSGSTIMSACSSVSATTIADKDAIMWKWSLPNVADTVIDAIVLAIGDAAGSERVEVELQPTATSWLDTLESDGKGEAISSYDQRSRVKYLYTLERSIAGITDESGPSPLTSVVSSSGKNLITFRTGGENLGPRESWNMLPGYTMGADSVLETEYEVEKIAKDPVNGKWIFTLKEEHLFVDGESVFVRDLPAEVFGAFIEIVRHPDDPKSVIALTEPKTAVPSATASMRMLRAVTLDITKVKYDANAGMICVEVASEHTWKTGDEVQFVGFKDTAWTSGTILVNPEHNKKFWITDKPSPADKEGEESAVGLSVRKPMSVMQLADFMPEGMGPTVGTILFMTLSGVDYDGEVLGIFGKKIVLGGCYTGEYAPSIQDSIEYVKDNGHVGFRNLYRVGAGGDSAGGTSDIRRVAKVPYRKRKFEDVVPDSSLGDVLPTYYSSALGFVVYDAPPLGIDHLTLHQDMLFATSGHDLLWTDRGFPNAWASVFRHSFATRIMGLRSYNGALIVFCQDRLYRVDGGDPTMLAIHPTDATEGAISHAIVEANSRIYYLAARGLMEFNGAGAACLTDHAIPGEFWRQTSVYKDPMDTAGAFLVGAVQSQGYQALLDSPVKRIAGLGRTRDNYVAENIRAFAWDGKVVLYWADNDRFQASGACIIDTTRNGAPVQFTGIKIMDAHVDELERPYVLLGQPDPPTTVKAIPDAGVWDVDEFVAGAFNSYINARAPHPFLMATLPPVYGLNQWDNIGLRLYIPGLVDGQSARGTCTVEFPPELDGFSSSMVMIPGEQFPTIAGNAWISVGLPYGGQTPVPLGMHNISIKAKLDSDPEEYFYNLRIKVVPFYETTVDVISDELVDPGRMVRLIKMRVVVNHDEATLCSYEVAKNIFEDSVTIKSVAKNQFEVMFNTYEHFDWKMSLVIEDAESASRILNNAGDWVRPVEGDLRRSTTRIHVSSEIHGQPIPVRYAGTVYGDTYCSTVVDHDGSAYAVGGYIFANPMIQDASWPQPEYPAYWTPENAEFVPVKNWTLDTMIGGQYGYELGSAPANNPFKGPGVLLSESAGIVAVANAGNDASASVFKINTEDMRLDVFANIGRKTINPVVYSSSEKIVICGGHYGPVSNNFGDYYKFVSPSAEGESVTTHVDVDEGEDYYYTNGNAGSGTRSGTEALIATEYDLIDPVEIYKNFIGYYWPEIYNFSNGDFVSGQYYVNIPWSQKFGEFTLAALVANAPLPCVQSIFTANNVRLS